jgi:hypothetical protein
MGYNAESLVLSDPVSPLHKYLAAKRFLRLSDYSNTFVRFGQNKRCTNVKGPLLSLYSLLCWWPATAPSRMHASLWKFQTRWFAWHLRNLHPSQMEVRLWDAIFSKCAMLSVAVLDRQIFGSLGIPLGARSNHK